MSIRPRVPDRLRALAISDTGFIFDPRTGYSYMVNATGLILLRALKEGLSLVEAAARLRAEFDADDAPVEDDVEGFLGLLREHGLIPAVAADHDGEGRQS